jgi:adenine-specific DNA-methyltransferase
MATIETLIGQIDDPALRDRLGREVAELKKRLDWGLVFERHLPENVRALVAPIKPGSVVWERHSATPRRLRVRAIDGAYIVVVPEPHKTTAPTDAPTERIRPTEVLVEQDFAEPVFPVPTPIEAVRNGPPAAPYHAVIEGENFHAIQSLLVAYERSFDLIYLDPPYNTGNRDWSYNNNYVDSNDTYRPSKWLAFMERRLRIAQRLLKPDGVIVVTIDENEVHHLGMLLGQLFPEAQLQMVTIAINPSGTSGDGFSRVDEYAFFAFFGGTQPSPTFEDFFGPEDRSRARWWDSLLRGGREWVRASRRNLCYPIFIDGNGRFAGAGEPFQGEDEAARPTHQGGFELAWPVRSDGRLGIWRVDADRLRALAAKGYAVVSKPDPRRGTWSIRYLLDGAVQAIERGEIEVQGEGPLGDAILTRGRSGKVTPKTVWHRARHAAGATWGTNLLRALVGDASVFPFPKSLYAVRDTIDAAVGNRKDALVLDFFAGSGTTLHATMLLNAADGGHRRCVLVTNNEVNYRFAETLNRRGVFRGDLAFEAMGVFESATKPRVIAALTGRQPDGQPAEGEYLDGTAIAEGFAANIEFFRLDYLDPAEVEFGMRYAEIEPLLWLRAGGIGHRVALDPANPLGLPAHSPYAVLFDPAGLPDLVAELRERPDVTHVFIVADSPESFAQIASDLPREIEKVRLYRDYLETLRGATR